MHYSRFDLLCINEFPNVLQMDPLLIQQMFNTFSERSFHTPVHAMPAEKDEGVVLNNKHRTVHKRTDSSEGKEASSLQRGSPSDKRFIRDSTIPADRFSKPKWTHSPCKTEDNIITPSSNCTRS